MQRIFVTGASGFVGQAICQELIKHGYQVLGLTRSEQGERQLKRLGVNVVNGDLTQTNVLKSAIEQADAVIHTAFNHNFATFAQNCRDDFNTIQLMGEMLHGSARPLIVTSGAFYSGKELNYPAEHAIASESFVPRVASDLSVHQLVEKGINTKLVGLPQVHNTERFGLISYLIDIAKKTGSSAYIGDGNNMWSAAHLTDIATLYRLVLEQGKAGYKYIGVAEQSIALKQIAETIAQKFSLPANSISKEQAAEHFGWLAHLAQETLNTSGEFTKQTLNWQPTGPGLFEDIKNAELA